MQEDRVPRIVPRVVVEMQPEQHMAMLTVLKTDVTQLLVRECKRNRFDGLVSALHSPSTHAVRCMSCTLGCAGACAPADQVTCGCRCRCRCCNVRTSSMCTAGSLRLRKGDAAMLCACVAASLRDHAASQVLEVWFTWHAMGLLQEHFALAKSFLQSLAKSLHKQDGHDGLPMVLSALMGQHIYAT